MLPILRDLAAEAEVEAAAEHHAIGQKQLIVRLPQLQSPLGTTFARPDRARRVVHEQGVPVEGVRSLDYLDDAKADAVVPR
jgi:hypothetical protein